MVFLSCFEPQQQRCHMQDSSHSHMQPQQHMRQHHTTVPPAASALHQVCSYAGCSRGVPQGQLTLQATLRVCNLDGSSKRLSGQQAATTINLEGPCAPTTLPCSACPCRRATCAPHPPMCPQNSALVFFKRFYTQASCLEHDPLRVMPTCIYLACKVSQDWPTDLLAHWPIGQLTQWPTDSLAQHSRVNLGPVWITYGS